MSNHKDTRGGTRVLGANTAVLEMKKRKLKEDMNNLSDDSNDSSNDEYDMIKWKKRQSIIKTPETNMERDSESNT